MNELALISSWKHEWLTQISLEAIWIIIEEIFDKQIKNEQIKMEIDLEEAYEQKDENEVETFLNDSWINKIFEPLEKQMKSDFSKNKLIIWNTIGNTLRKHGNYLSSSIWSKILVIILMIAKTDNSDWVQNGFKLSKLITIVSLIK